MRPLLFWPFLWPLTLCVPYDNWTSNYDPDYAEFAMDFAAASYAVDPVPCIQKNKLSVAIQTKVACDYAYDQVCFILIQTLL